MTSGLSKSRIAHIERVVENARIVEARIPFQGRLLAAAMYHDIGYAPEFAKTGFHPVDSAILAFADEVDPAVVEAVLHHTGAFGEARRCRPDLMFHFADSCLMMKTRLNRALTFCDLRAGVNGEKVSMTERLNDIAHRHAGNKPLLEVMCEYAPLFQQIDDEFSYCLAAQPLSA